jgi:hypothetical protein
LADGEFRTQVLEGLAQELRRDNDADKPKGAPTIYWEEVKGYTHYFAVWDRFEFMERPERHSVLMDAIEAWNEDEALKVTVAVGLTPDEAKAMGLGLE